MNESAEHQATLSRAELPDAAALHKMPFRWVMLGLLFYGASGTCLMPLLVLTLMETPEVASKYLGSATGAFFLSSLGVIILTLMLPLKISSTTAEGKT